MDDLLERLKRERRWTVAIFIAGAVIFGLIRLAVAPDTQAGGVDVPTPAAEHRP